MTNSTFFPKESVRKQEMKCKLSTPPNLPNRGGTIPLRGIIGGLNQYITLKL